MCAGLHYLIGKLEVVVQRVELFIGISKVAGKAHANLGQSSGLLTDGLDGWSHLTHVIECVEDSEDINPGAGSFLDKCARDLLWIWGVANGVSASQKHLDTNVWQCLTQSLEPAPRVFTQEPKCNVVGRSAPGLDR